MIRNRGGDFVYNPSDIQVMLNQLEQLKTLPIAGIVFGALTLDDQLDIPTIHKIAQAAQPLAITIHKCIDQVENYKEAINKLKLIPNIKYILSSGTKSTAYKGLQHLRKMKSYASPQIEIIAAGKITSDNISKLHKLLALNFYHGKRIVQSKAL